MSKAALQAFVLGPGEGSFDRPWYVRDGGEGHCGGHGL